MPKDGFYTDTEKRFISVFTDEFIRELKFIVDISRGRAQDRASFCDQLIGKISLGTEVLSALGNFFPAGGVAFSAAGLIVTAAAYSFKYLYEYDRNSNIDEVISEAGKPEIILQLMIEGVARELVRRHEFFLNHMCHPDAVDLFAIVGIARILQYLSDHKNLSFNSENLLKGAIEGKSGAWQQGFRNNKLKSIHFKISSVSAETVYAYSAHMNGHGQYYARKAKKTLFSREKHYVKMIEHSSEKEFPKAGVMILRQSDIDNYGYPEITISENLREHLNYFSPGYVVLYRADIERYMQTTRQGDTTTLIHYFGNKRVICRDDLSGLDLSNGQFDDVDFSGSILNNAILNNASFKNSLLVEVIANRVQAINVDFGNARLSLIIAVDGAFEGSNFNEAIVWYGKFVGANLTNIQFLGTDWHGSDFTRVVSTTIAQSTLENLSLSTYELLHQQNQLETSLTRIEGTLSEQQKYQATHVHEMQISLSQIQSEMRFELAKMNSQLVVFEEKFTQDAQSVAEALTALREKIADYHEQYQIISLQLKEQDKTVKHIIESLSQQGVSIQRTWESITELDSKFETIKQQYLNLQQDIQTISTKMSEQLERIISLEQGQVRLEHKVEEVHAEQIAFRMEILQHILSNARISPKASIETRLQLIRKRVIEDTELKKDLDLYIPVRCVQGQVKAFSQPRRDLEDETLKFLASEKRVMLLSGGAGEGKSTFNRYLERKLWVDFEVGKSVPIFASLPSLQNPMTNLLQEYFQNEGFTHEEISLLQRDYSFVLILDGYDEMNATPKLYTTNNLERYQVKVIISCRSQYFAQMMQYQDFFMPIHGERFLESSFQELTTVPFNEQQIDAYIAKYLAADKEEDSPLLWDTVEGYRHHINAISGLKDLVTTPFLLMIALKVMPEIVEKYVEVEAGTRQKVTQTALYEAFMRFWFRRGYIQAMQHGATSAWSNPTLEFQRTSEELAKEMYFSDVMQVRFLTSEVQAGITYESQFSTYDINTVGAADLPEVYLEEHVMRLLFVRDAETPDERWRIVARNNAGSPTFVTPKNALAKESTKTGWLLFSELVKRWSLRDPSVLAHQEKLKALNYAFELLRKNTPETLDAKQRDIIFHAILLGLTHPWERFFDFTNPHTRQIIHGVPVKLANKGGYTFIHAEILSHFSTAAMVREESLLASPTRSKKPWDKPVAPLLASQGQFQAPPVHKTTVVHQTTTIHVTQKEPEPKSKCIIM